MPRSASVHPTEIETILKKINPFDQNGQLLKKSDAVWKKASSLLKNAITGPTLYFYLKRDWNNLSRDLIKYWTENGAFKKKNLPESVIKPKLIDHCPEKHIHLNVSEDEWISFKPVINIKDQSRYQLPYGWTHDFENIILNQTNIPCPFMFTKGWYSKKEMKITIKGSCKECGNGIIATCADLKSRIFYVETKDSSYIRHFSKRPASKQYRVYLGQKLIHEKPLKVRRDESDEKMMYGQIERADVMNTPVLRKIRQEAIFKKYEVRMNSKDIVEEIIWMKSQKKWSDILLQINDFPFSVIFATSEQIDFWINASSRPGINVSVDAAGRFVKKIKFEGDISSHIFLYIISTSVGGKIYPLFQFISEYQAANFIKHCIEFWLRRGAPVPKECVMDHSSALLNATCSAFNKCTYKQYLARIYDALLNNKINEFDCFLRIDIAHLIKSITRWKCFDQCDAKVKDFYIRIIGYLSTVTSLDEFFDIIQSTFAVCQSPGIDSTVQKHQDNLINVIKFHVIALCPDDCDCDNCNRENKLSDQDDIASDEDCSNDLSTIKTKIAQIVNEALLLQCKNNQHNEYYCLNFVNNFSALCEECIAWTNVATKFFKSDNLVASSGRSESLFSDLRHITNIHRPISGQLFLAIYIGFLNGSLKLGKAFLENEKLLSPYLDDSSNLEKLKLRLNYDPENVENCENKTPVKGKIKTRGKYLEPFVDVKIHHSRPHLQPFKTVIMNGILRRPAKYNNELYFFTNTSLFDSIFELIGTSYLNYSVFKNYIDISCVNDDCLCAMIKVYFVSGKEDDLYKTRLKLCVKYFSIEEKSMTLYCKNDAGSLLKALFNKCFPKLLYLKIINSGSELLNLQKINYYIENEIASNKLSLDKFLFIDIGNFFNEKEVLSLEDIPVRINIQKVEYLLTGVVATVQSKFDLKLLHHVCFCRTYRNNWYLKDDLILHIQCIKKNTNKSITPVFFMYVQNL